METTVKLLSSCFSITMTLAPSSAAVAAAQAGCSPRLQHRSPNWATSAGTSGRSKVKAGRGPADLHRSLWHHCRWWPFLRNRLPAGASCKPAPATAAVAVQGKNAAAEVLLVISSPLLVPRIARGGAGVSRVLGNLCFALVCARRPTSKLYSAALIFAPPTGVVFLRYPTRSG